MKQLTPRNQQTTDPGFRKDYIKETSTNEAVMGAVIRGYGISRWLRAFRRCQRVVSYHDHLKVGADKGQTSESRGSSDEDDWPLRWNYARWDPCAHDPGRRDSRVFVKGSICGLRSRDWGSARRRRANEVCVSRLHIRSSPWLREGLQSSC